MTTQFLEHDGGQIAYDDTGGTGPLVIAAPGMGDVRTVYRHLTPLLTDAGLRVVTMDLRGLGESSVEWGSYTDEAVASDYLALVDHLNSGSALLIGNSKTCASAVIAATTAPDKVKGIAVLGPFVRVVPMKWWQKAAFVVMLAPPWGQSAWVAYYRKNLYPGPKPADHDDYTAKLSSNLQERGRMAAFRKLAADDHAESGRRLGDVSVPALVVMGTADPDFPDATAEAKDVAAILNAKLVFVEGSGHYPQADNPNAVAPAIIDLVQPTNG
ncbi:MAG: alpha/beta hydrolase [Acidimicrobiia bacterium]|nr:alpha/beta hydrolase [Acidimicrobiia bacterium]